MVQGGDKNMSHLTPTHLYSIKILWKNLRLFDTNILKKNYIFSI
jgi:hypothetical protein